MSEGRSKVRVHALPAGGGAAACLPVAETPAGRRAREKRAIDEARRKFLSVDANRRVLAGLAKR
jgi:hypothetical protein